VWCGESKHMKICLIVDDYLPDSIKVAAKMMHELAVEFVNRGHSVMVITPDSNLKEKYRIIELDGVKVCYFRSGEIKNTGNIKRAMNETLLSFNAWNAYKMYFKENPCDLIIYYSPSIFWGQLVSKLKKLWDAPSYLILRDFFPQWAIDNGMIKKNSLIDKYFRYFEALNYNVADTIAIQSPKNLKWFRDLYPDKSLELVYNWASDNPVKTKDSYYRKKYNLENKVVFFYGGNIGHAQDMMNIVRLAQNLVNEEKAHFVLVGKGDEYELVSNYINKNNIKNITLLPPVSQEEFKFMLAEFDIGLFSLHKDHITHNFPGKLLGYMVQEKPILGSVNEGNDLKEIVENSNAGFISISGEDQILKENALKLLYNNKLRVKMGNNAKILLRSTFSVKNTIIQIEKNSFIGANNLS
jgi:glycosyltransferase involved in cell wall biosynthesis